MPETSASRILVVDDTEATRYLVVRILQREGYAISQAATGSEALELVRRDKPDLVVLDVKLPDMLGFDVTRQIKADPLLASTVVLQVSATYTEADARAFGLQQGADGYLTHPIEGSVLAATIKALLRMRQAEQRVWELVQAEQQLRVRAEENEAHYRFLADLMPQLVFAADADGELDFVNRRWCEYTGLTAVESRGHGWQKRVHPDDRETVTRAWGQSIESGQAFSTECRLESAVPGEYGWFLGRALPLLARHDRIIRWFGTFTDIEEQKRSLREREEFVTDLEQAVQARDEALAYLDAVIDCSPVAIALFDRHARYTRVNDALAKMNGLPPEAHTGKTTRELLPLVGEPVHALVEQVLATGQPVRVAEYGGYTPADPTRERWWTASLYPVRVRGKPAGIAGLVSEITEAKEADQERARLMRELEEALRARDEFLSIASHDMNGPLQALRLKLETLRLQMVRRVPLDHEAIGQKLAAAIEQSERASKFLEEMLDASRMSAGKIAFDLGEVDLGHTVEDVVKRYQEQLAAAGCPLELELEDGVIGRWDARRVDQLVSNLLSNAIKYGRRNPIEIRVKRAGTLAVLAVCDRGVGIAPEHQHRIFQRFERVSETREAGSFGVGLWIAQRISDALGGSISVKSEPGEGSTFTVELPLAGPPDA